MTTICDDCHEVMVVRDSVNEVAIPVVIFLNKKPFRIGYGSRVWCPQCDKTVIEIPGLMAGSGDKFFAMMNAIHQPGFQYLRIEQTEEEQKDE